MGKLLATVRGHIYPRSTIELGIETGDLRASRAIGGMIAVIGATLLISYVVMIVAGVIRLKYI